jgi:hypothetical protein
MTTLISYDTRRAVGSADLDVYRATAIALRRQAARDGKTLQNLCGGLLALAGAAATLWWWRPDRLRRPGVCL